MHHPSACEIQTNPQEAKGRDDDDDDDKLLIKFITWSNIHEGILVKTIIA